MATKMVTAAITLSLADLKGLVSDQSNQQQLQWAHGAHRTLLMVGWVLLSSEQTPYFIHLSLQGNPAISIK